ncbi:MarR family winged helix-turn-helix transcriptional regulator [Corynebacterium marquesiae]|uniref:MarR family winged helix-turn-helix transcriptional regulator n=1 Tax=Corynebacterium marquesiae TaxID=2913503 RepID=UPI0038D0D6FF
MNDAPTDRLVLDSQLCFALYRANRAVVRSYRPLLAELGLTYPQYLVMLVLWEADEPVPLKFIDSRLGLDSGTLTPLLKRLEKQGYVQRWRDPDDERRTLAALTADGDALRSRAECIPEAMAEAYKEFGVDLAEFKESLDILAGAAVDVELPWPSEDDFVG